MSDHPATAPLRAQHADLMEELERLQALLPLLLQPECPERLNIMTSVIDYVRLQIRPRAAWEEQALYPAIDALMGPLDVAFTATMRREHELAGGWVQRLIQLRDQEPAQDSRFALEAASLLAFIRAHFQVQEDVLLPVLDDAYTPERFLQEILSSQDGSLRLI